MSGTGGIEYDAARLSDTDHAVRQSFAPFKASPTPRTYNLGLIFRSEEERQESDYKKLPDRQTTMSLVRLGQAGDEEAFAEIVRLYQDIAVAYATSILRDYALAQDVVQEAFVDAYRALATLRDPAAFAAWFRRIVFKHCDRVTRGKHPSTTGLDAALAVASPAPSPHEALEQSESRGALRAAIATLSDVEQQVVLLFYLGDRSHAEIAGFLGVNANTVKTRLYSARRRLRTHMSELERDLRAARPSGDSAFIDKVRRLIQPDALKKREPVYWTPPAIAADLWSMFTAAITGDLTTIRDLVAQDKSLVRAWYEYKTPLSFAVRENQLEVASFLIEHGADVINSGGAGTLAELAHDRGYTEMEQLLQRALTAAAGGSPSGSAPVAAALRDRDLPRVRRLLDASPELLHAVDEWTNQPIHWAVMTRQLDAIDELLARGADINARRANGARPIHLTNGDYHYRGWRDVPAGVTTTPDDVYRHLVARGADVDIGMACVKGDLPRVQTLIDRDPSLVNRLSDYTTYYIGSGAPLKNAAAAGHLDIVRLLLARGADPNLPEPGIAPRGHALYSAVYNGHYEIAKLLLEHGAYPNVEVESSADTLSIAKMRGDSRIVELLCSYGAARSIHLLAHMNDIETAAAVFAANPSLANDPDVLTNATENGHEAFVRLLLRYQPDLPRRVAAGSPRREIAALLFHHGMDPNFPNWLRMTALHRFAEWGDVENAAVFLDHGANLEARDEDMCSTPLGWAAKHGRRLMVDFLLRRGARVSPPDVPPWAMPIACANSRGHSAIAELLMRAASGPLPPRPEVAAYESLAADLVAAYGSGDTDALRRIVEYFNVWRVSNLSQLRRFVGPRLALRTQDDDESPQPISLDEAGVLVARMHGFPSWGELLEQAGR